MVMKRRAPRRTLRRTRRAMRRPRMTRSVAVRTNLVNIKRSFVTAPFTVNNSWSGIQLSFTLSALPNYSEFTALFEQYRINGVKLTFVPSADSLDINQQQQNSSSAINWTTIPRLYTAIDKDGNGQYASENAILQYGNHRIIRNPMRAFTIYVKHPCVQMGTANLVTIVGGAPKARQWLDCDNYNVQHWGAVVGGIVPYQGGTTVNMAYQVIATYYMQFKNAV